MKKSTKKALGFITVMSLISFIIFWTVILDNTLKQERKKEFKSLCNKIVTADYNPKTWNCLLNKWEETVFYPIYRKDELEDIYFLITK